MWHGPKGKPRPEALASTHTGTSKVGSTCDGCRGPLLDVFTLLLSRTLPVGGGSLRP